MKTLVFSNSTGVHVELLTDLINDNESFTVYQVQERVNGRLQIGLTDSSIALGFNFQIAEYDLGEMIIFAQAKDMTLIAYETGKELEVIYQGTYYGDAIGGELV